MTFDVPDATFRIETFSQAAFTTSELAKARMLAHRYHVSILRQVDELEAYHPPLRTAGLKHVVEER
jgi:hypothetical protein